MRASRFSLELISSFAVGLLLANLAAATAAPKPVVNWNHTLDNRTVAGVAGGMVLLTSTSPVPEGFRAVLECVDAATGQVLWSDTNISNFSTGYTVNFFPAAPNYIFIIDANTYPVTLTAYYSRNGSVAWTLANFSLNEPYTITPQPDGSILYLVYYGAATTVDAFTGVILASSIPFEQFASPMFCGPKRLPCAASLGAYNYDNGTVLNFVYLYDARLGTPIATTLTLHQFIPYQYILWGADDVLLLFDGSSSASRLSTTDLKAMWKLTFPFVFAYYSPLLADYTVPNTTNRSRAIVGASDSGTLTIDAESGATLPSTSVASLCPEASDFLVKFTLLVRGRVGAVVTCYPTPVGETDIFAVFDVANMSSPLWSVNTTAQFYDSTLLLVEPSSFLLIANYQTNTTSVAELYDANSFALRSQYSAFSPAVNGPNQPLLAWATGRTVLLQQTGPTGESSYLSGIHP